MGFAPVFYFHEIHKLISETGKWGLSDEIYKKTDEFSNFGSRQGRLFFLEANILYICYYVIHKKR